MIPASGSPQRKAPVCSPPRDCGLTFENLGRVGVDRNTYDIAFDPGRPNRIALAVWGTGVVVSEDRGQNLATARPFLAERRNLERRIRSCEARTPVRQRPRGSDLRAPKTPAVTWTRDGLEGSTVSRMKFIQEPAR